MTLYPIPQLTTEITFDPPSVPDASATWVNVSSYVRTTSGVVITRGRSDERASRTDPGTLTLTLDNRDGRFTPGKTSSPYYPNVIPWRRIRQRLSTGALLNVFHGYIRSWSLTWDAPSAPVVQVQAVDSLAMCARRKLRSVLAEEILADVPAAYYRLDEPDGASAAWDAMGGRALTPTGDATGDVAFAAGTGVPTDAASSVVISGQLNYLSALRTVPGGTDVTVEAFVNVSAAPTGTSRVVLVNVPFALGAYVAFAVNTSGNLVVATGLNTQECTTTPIANGRTHHLAATCNNGTITGIWVDGVSQSTSAAVFVGSLDELFAGYIVSSTAVALTIGHIAAYSTQLSSGRIAAHYAAGMTGFAGEDTFARIQRWCGYVGMGVGHLLSGLGEPLAHIDTTGRTVLECIEDALATDYGSRIEASRVETWLWFTARSDRYGQASSVTLDCSADEINDDIRVLSDPTYIAPTVNVTTPQGVHSLTNADVLATYGEGSIDMSAYPSDDGFADSLSEWVSREAATPTPRIPSVSTELITMALDTSKYDASAIPELGDVVTITGLPATAPATSLTLYVEGVTETLSATTWTREVTLSPAAPWTNVWTIQGAGNSGKVEAGYVIAL